MQASGPLIFENSCRWPIWTTNRLYLTFPGQIPDLKSKNPIFDSGYSRVSLLIMGCSLLICITLLGIALFYIRHYPVPLSLLSLFLLRTIVDARVERLVVLEDRLVIVSRRLLPFMTRRQVILFSAVESIDSRPGGKVILVRYKDGDCRQLSPSIRAGQFREAAGVIGGLYNRENQ